MSPLHKSARLEKTNHSIAAAVHYCTNDYRFLRKVVDEAKKFSRLIIIPVCDHFFNGEKENRALLDRTYCDFPDCQFIEFAYYPDRLYHRLITHFTPNDREWGFFWHSTSRYLAALFLPKDIEYVLFLDSDEVIDGDRFLEWLNLGLYRSFLALRLRCYIYAHRPTLRAQQIFNSALMARPRVLDASVINAEDRHGLFNILPEPKKKNLLDESGAPFIHHYSWVRPQNECYRKSETWGHRLDMDWKQMIDKMFQQPGNYDVWDLNATFEETQAFFDPLAVPVPSVTASPPFPNVIKVDEPMIFRKSIERLL